MPIPRRTQWTDTMDIDFVTATLEKYGLSDRFDAGEITQRSDSTDRAIRYVSRVRRSSHQLRLDDWKRLGRDQMGQKCGRGWQGLRGACKRVPKGGDKEAAIKASKVALADKIRKSKGLRDRNAPKVEDDSLQRLEQLIALKKTPPQTASIASSSIKQPEAQQSKAAKNREAQRLEEGSKVVAGGMTRKELDDFSFESVGRRSVGQLSELPNGQIVTFRGEGRSRRSSGIPDGDYFQVTKTTKSGSTYGIPLDKSGKPISDKPIRLKNIPSKWLEVADVDEDQKKYGTFGSIEELNTKYGRSDSDDSHHFDSAEITRYTRAIAVLNDRYGWHLDAQKVLSKLGKKLGKKCGGGWIAPEKKCRSHYTNGKLNAAGKASGENLADRIRTRKKLAAVSRNGKGEELTYAFLPGNQKQSTMTARRTHAPKNGYETPGRLSNLSNTEERRSMVGLGQSPWKKRQPDDAPIMDLPTKKSSAPTPIDAGRSLKSLFAEADRIGAKYQDEPQTLDERRVSKQGADRIMHESGMTELVAKASGAASISEARTRKMNEPEKAGLVAKALGVSSLDKQRKLKTSSPTVEGVELKKGHKVWETDLYDNASPDKARPTEKTVVGWSKDGKTVTLRRNDLNAEQSAMARERNNPGLFDRQYPASVLRLSKASALETVSKYNEKISKDKDDSHQRRTEALTQEIETRKNRESNPSASEPQTRKMNPNPSAGDRLRAIAGKLKDEESIQKVATVGILKAAEKLYVNQHKMIGEVAGIVNEDLDRAAAKGVRKIFDPAQTPVRIPNQRSSKEPRQRGRSVD